VKFLKTATVAVLATGLLVAGTGTSWAQTIKAPTGTCGSLTSVSVTPNPVVQYVTNGGNPSVRVSAPSGGIVLKSVGKAELEAPNGKIYALTGFKRVGTYFQANVQLSPADQAGTWSAHATVKYRHSSDNLDVTLKCQDSADFQVKKNTWLARTDIKATRATGSSHVKLAATFWRLNTAGTKYVGEGGHATQVQYRKTHSAAWTTLTSVTSHTGGSLTADVVKNHQGYWRFYYGGSSTLWRSASDEVYVGSN
jgi:hypothetical protein